MSVFEAPVFELSILDAPHALHVVSFRGREAMSRPYRFDVTAIGPEIDGASLEADYVGQRALLTIGKAGDEPRRIAGVIARIEAEAAPLDRSSADRHRYRLRLVPGLWLLSRGRDSRIFQEKTVPEIACAVLGDRGVRVRLALGRTYEKRVYCVQYEEHDLGFVERLLREEGIYYFFDPPEDETEDEILVLADEAGAARPIPGESILRFREQATEHEAGSTIQRFSLERRLAAGTTILRDFDFLRPSYSNIAQASTHDLSDPLTTLTSLAETALRDPGAALAGAQALVSSAQRTVEGAVRTASRAVADPAAALRRLEREARRAARGQAQRAISAATSGLRDAIPGADAVLSRLPEVSIPGLGSLGTSVIEPVGYLGADEATRYDHHREHETTPLRIEDARRFLEQERRGVWVGAGRSRCPALMPGRRFSLAEAPISGQDGEYTLFEVEHRGQDPAYASPDRGRIEVYSCELRCVPGGVPFRPKPRRRRIQQVIETATVVGPAGQEIHTDPHGRIKVQFHWDRGGSRDERSSCWIRVSQPWAGAGFGVSFLPRVGTEVTVGFLGGDMDKPVILGAVHNAERPPPFPLPGEKTKSGIRTESTRGGGGHNELSFEDRKGYERVHLRAEKDLDILVRNNETTRVEANQVSHVGVNQYAVVAANRIAAVGGDEIATVTGNQRTTVEGDRTTEVHGQSTTIAGKTSSQRFAEDLHVRVERDDVREVRRNAEIRVDNDLAVRVTGNYSVVVGDADHRRSSVIHTIGAAEYSCDDKLEIQADKGIQLICGRSILAISKERITLCSPEIGLFTPDAKMVLAEKKARLIAKEKIVVQADETNLRGSGSMVNLTGGAEVKGSAVKLGSGSPPSDSLSGPGRRRLTKIELTDQDGHPLPFQRFVAHLGDGSERVGVLDENGRAEIEITGGGQATITFPEVSNPEAR